MEIEAENNKYKLIKNYREAFDKEMFLARYTDYYKKNWRKKIVSK